MDLERSIPVLTEKKRVFFKFNKYIWKISDFGRCYNVRISCFLNILFCNCAFSCLAMLNSPRDSCHAQFNPHCL